MYSTPYLWHCQNESNETVSILKTAEKLCYSTCMGFFGFQKTLIETMTSEFVQIIYHLFNFILWFIFFVKLHFKQTFWLYKIKY